MNQREERCAQMGLTRIDHQTEHTVENGLCASSYSSSVENFGYEGYESLLLLYMAKKSENPVTMNLDAALR